MVLANFRMPVFNEQAHHVGMSLNQFGSKSVVRSFLDLDALFRLLNLHTYFRAMAENCREKGITQVNASPLLDSAVHCIYVFLNLFGNLGVVGFSYCLHAVLQFRYSAFDFGTMRQQVLEIRLILFHAIVLPTLC